MSHSVLKLKSVVEVRFYLSILYMCLGIRIPSPFHLGIRISSLFHLISNTHSEFQVPKNAETAGLSLHLSKVKPYKLCRLAGGWD